MSRVDPTPVERRARLTLALAPPGAAGIRRVETALALVPRFGGDAARITQAVVNLLGNAITAAADGGGERQVAIRTRSLPGGEVCVEVEDDGVGIRPEILSRVGEPYLTTRADRGALGLGLFVARGIAEAHGGRLEVESRPGEGTCARLVFPAGALSARSFTS